MINNKLYNYLGHSFRRENDHKDKAIIKKCIKKSFFGKENLKNKKLFNKFSKNLEILNKISDNVLIVKNLYKFLNELQKTKNIFLLSKESEKAFNKNYNNFLVSKEKIYYEDITKGRELKKIINFINKKDYLIVCIGGGKVSDLAKFISLKTNTSLINIPTILATHVYTSPKIHTLNPIKDLGYHLTIDGKASNFSLIDLRIITRQFNKQPRFVLSGLGDLMAFFNSKHDWQISENIRDNNNKFIIKSIKKVENILKKIDPKKSLNYWLKDYIFAQVLLCNITDWAGSAPASGAEHFFANLYEKYYPKKVLHGELVAIGTLIFLFLRKKNYFEVLRLIKKFKINNSLKKLYLSKSKILNILIQCKKEGVRKKRISILEILNLEKKDFRKIINEMMNKKVLRI